MRELEEKEAIQRQMREETNYKSYRDWLKKQMIREKNERLSTIKRNKDMLEREKQGNIQKSIDA